MSGLVAAPAQIWLAVAPVDRRRSIKNETLSPLQRDLLAETLAADSAAIEVELEQLADAEPCPTVAKSQPPPAGRQPLPAHLPRLEHRLEHRHNWSHANVDTP
ncbi:MAG: transposase [Methylobacter sp.]|nr:transposase [Methylobacter sp.]